MDVLNGIFSESFWYIAPILVTMTTGLAGLINQGCKVKQGWLKQLISWIIGAGLSVSAWALKVITFGDPIWLGVVCLCVVVGLASNGFYDIPTISNWINSWFKKVPTVQVPVVEKEPVTTTTTTPELMTTTTTPEMMTTTTTPELMTTTTTPEYKN